MPSQQLFNVQLMINNFTHKNYETHLDFNYSGLAVSCGILERERERERDASSVIIKQKFLLCQNDGAFFYASGFVMSLSNLQIFTFVNHVIYINFFTEIRLYKLCTAVLLLFCCRSESASSIYLSDSRFHYAVGCSECTLLLLCVINNYLRTNIINGSGTLNNNRVCDPQTNNDEKENFGDVMLYSYDIFFACSGRHQYHNTRCEC